MKYLNRERMHNREDSGVYPYKNKNSEKYISSIYYEKKQYHLGTYVDKEEAIKIRKEAEEHLETDFIDWFEKRNMVEYIKNIKNTDIEQFEKLVDKMDKLINKIRKYCPKARLHATINELNLLNDNPTKDGIYATTNQNVIVSSKHLSHLNLEKNNYFMLKCKCPKCNGQLSYLVRTKGMLGHKINKDGTLSKQTLKSYTTTNIYIVECEKCNFSYNLTYPEINIERYSYIEDWYEEYGETIG